MNELIAEFIAAVLIHMDSCEAELDCAWEYLQHYVKARGQRVGSAAIRLTSEILKVIDSILEAGKEIKARTKLEIPAELEATWEKKDAVLPG